MEAVLIGIAVLAALASLFAYNPMRRKMAGIVGVGGAYVILVGLMTLVMVVGQVVTGNAGTNVPIGEVITEAVVALVCVGYMVYVMLTRCHTTGQKVLLPVASVLIGFGFCYRLVWALITHAPVGGEQASPEDVFPETITSPEGESFRREWAAGEHAGYWCARTGQKVQFWTYDFKDGGCPSGWSR